eukprot:COSAG01_NODE_3097_length_6590_cov_20.121707_4_plen_98_part_00
MHTSAGSSGGDSRQALLACVRREGLRPKVILATNVAESSLTIPGVSLVVDLCRRLQVCWDAERQASRAQIHWASRSQLDQRKVRGCLFRVRLRPPVE